MRFNVGSRVVYLNLKFKVFNINNYQMALHSGMPFKRSHYLLLDYDEFNPVDDMIEIIMKYKLKRALVLESSPGKYHGISFTPLPYEKMIEIMRESESDMSHLSVSIKRGFSAIRVTPKESFKIRITKELNNRNPGTNFYNYDAEKVYLEQLECDKLDVNQ